MAYKALYRQWRPRDFEGLVGQEHVSVTLKNAITSGRISHAYLFTGPRGTGKTSTAKVLAKALNCEEGPTATPCNRCRSCELINDGSAMDVYEIDAASNRGIDEIRDLRENVKFSPAQSRYKIYIIDEVHMLTNEAFNALLKTLEEPPAHVVFVLATTEPHRIPATILSRCQRYDFRRVGVRELTDHLAHIARESGITATPEALRLIALQSDGGVRDAVSILDQCSVLGNDGVTEKEVRELLGLVGQEAVYRLCAAVVDGDGAAALAGLEEQMALGKDARQLLIELAGYCRSLMLYRATPNLDSPVLAAYGRDRLEADSRRLTHEQLVRLVELFYEAANNSRWSVDPRITAEMALLTACTPVLAAAPEPAARPDSRPQPPARPQPTAASAASPPKPALHAADSASPLATAIAAKMPATPAAVLTEQDLERAMDELLRKVEQAGKRSVKELLKDATLAGYSGGVATLLFQREMIRERVEKDDIRKWLESLLTQIVGTPIRLHCTTERSRKPVQSASPTAEAEIPEAVLRLQKLFGGKITKIEEEQS
ncbi:MAG: DNA polymerase III subunit gamma/tau [Veillonellaceae bacterium]|nr:DNA polymerase III subunit gamma/tau [Veillonellaceae bacterium]